MNLEKDESPAINIGVLLVQMIGHFHKFASRFSISDAGYIYFGWEVLLYVVFSVTLPRLGWEATTVGGDFRR